MSAVLVDTSVWVDHFRNRNAVLISTRRRGRLPECPGHRDPNCASVLRRLEDAGIRMMYVARVEIPLYLPYSGAAPIDVLMRRHLI